MARFVIDLGPRGDLPRDENIEFDIAGVTRDGEPWVESFEALPAMPAGLLADIADGLLLPIPKMAAFMINLLEPDSATRFEALIRDKDRLIRDVDLAAITNRLLEEMTGRPPAPSVDLPGGAGNTGTTSTGGSPSPVNGHATSTPDDSSTWLMPSSSTAPETRNSGRSVHSLSPLAL